MPSSIRIECDEPEVRTWLETWIGSTRLDPPQPLAIIVRVGDPGPRDARDVREPFRQPVLEMRSGPPQNDVRLEWLLAPARATIPADGGAALVEASPEAFRDRPNAQVLFEAVLTFLLRWVGWHHVHAATARDPRGRGWLIAGNTQCGKSTTSALLATWGWAVGTDDAGYLTWSRAVEDGGGAGKAMEEEARRVEVVGQWSRIRLRPQGLALLALSDGTGVRDGGRRACTAEELGGTWEQRIAPDLILFPRVGTGPTVVTPVRPREALAELVRWSPWVLLEPALAQQHLDILNALARQAVGYRVTLGPDLFGRRNLLMEMVP